MVMVNADGWRVEKIYRIVGDHVPVARLRISWHGFWRADCRITAEVSTFVDLSTLVPDGPRLVRGGSAVRLGERRANRRSSVGMPLPSSRL
jgi:hypothetical protein